MASLSKLDRLSVLQSYDSVRQVACGVRFLADGGIRAAAREEFLSQLKSMEPFYGFHLKFREAGPGRLGWCASRFAWGLVAWDWLATGGREALGPVHMHWVQGLLYGYRPDAIEEYLSRDGTPPTTAAITEICWRA